MDTRLHPSCITGICNAFNMHPEIEEAPTVQMHLSTLQRLCTIKYQTLGEVLQGSVNFRFFTKYFLSMMMRVHTYNPFQIQLILYLHTQYISTSCSYMVVADGCILAGPAFIHVAALQQKMREPQTKIKAGDVALTCWCLQLFIHPTH